MNLIKEIHAGMSVLTLDRRSLRSFAWVMATALFLLAAGIYFFGDVRERAFWFIGASLFFLIFGVLFPTFLKPIYKVWMFLALTLGWLMSRVLLTVVFFLLFTPIALIFKVISKDPLNRKIEKYSSSYWINRTDFPKDNSSYEKLY
ncbi:MAG: hypothetical protein EHM72_00230 [Calditrichaeota bacterium]|nr:MAG: hypothetical protein EHM72_00230 [Calditrichota bacterium]